MVNLRLCPEYTRRVGWPHVGYLLERDEVECWFVSDFAGQWTDFFEGEYWYLEDREEVAKSLDELPIAIPSPFILWGK